MTYEEFEWHILRMAYEDNVDRFRPPMLAYALGIPHDLVKSYLEQASHLGVLELDLSEDGVLEYFVPGLDSSRPVLTPIWKESEPAPQPASTLDEHGADGSVRPVSGYSIQSSDAPLTPPRRPSVPAVPASIHAHSHRREDSTAMVLHGDTSLAPLRVEASDEAFCDPSRTMFMRQIRVYGAQSPQLIREQVTRLFHSFGYRMVESSTERLRFERGSVMFILALVPLFVLVIPLFVYLFLYVMGRSTIQQEPVELDVQFRRNQGAEPYWEIDLTFVGLHGVVLGAADQQVLNREIDTLRDELKWSLAQI